MKDKVVLYKKTNSKTIRIWTAYIVENDNKTYTIKTEYGQLNGSMIYGPDTVISTGKAKRTIEEQTMLQFNSTVNKKKDGGYVEDISGEGSPLILPQLAYDYQSKANYEEYINNNVWLLSTKLDGVRALFAKIDDEIVAYTRKGKLITFATEHIKPLLKDYFEVYPNNILDGEIYLKGWDLKDINGIVGIKKQSTWESKGVLFKYNCFDVIELNNLESTNFTRWMHLQFVQSKNILPKNDYFDIVEQKLLCPKLLKDSVISEVKKYHDIFTEDGYEGAMIKLSDSMYYTNKRSYTILKFKQFIDSEFEIVGLTPGVKRPEDYVIVLKTEAGATFEAQPTGTVKDRMKLFDDISNNIGKMATVKYFYLTADGIPFLPKFKCIRIEA